MSKMPAVVFLAVTPDRMELPIAVGDSLSELSRMLGLDISSICCIYKKSRSEAVGNPPHHRERCRIRRVELEVDDHG